MPASYLRFRPNATLFRSSFRQTEENRGVTVQPIGASEWPRPAWRPGGRDAFVSLAVFGGFDPDTEATIASDVAGFRAQLMGRQEVVDLTTNLKPSRADEDAFGQAAASPGCLWIVGKIDDPPTLEYLRAPIQAVTRLLDDGCVGVLDMNAIVFQGAAERKRKVVDGQIQPLSVLATFWWSDEDGIGEWWRTRGMLTFGRPDISLRHIPAGAREHARRLIQRLALEMALGRLLEDGDQVEALIFRVEDAIEDPMFLNDRVEAVWHA